MAWVTIVGTHSFIPNSQKTMVVLVVTLMIAGQPTTAKLGPILVSGEWVVVPMDTIHIAL
jgi:hypothetical protein